MMRHLTTIAGLFLVLWLVCLVARGYGSTAAIIAFLALAAAS